MHVALVTTFASRKEPLADLLERIHDAFLTADPGEPAIRFSFSDAPLDGYVSSVDRVRKRFPEFDPFVSEAPILPGGPPIKQISGEGVPFTTLIAVATGVPRSFPFHNLAIHFTSPVFGEKPESSGLAAIVAPGVKVNDAWWINGRRRYVCALTIVAADPASKKLPAPPDPVMSILAACGKVKKTSQVPFVEAPPQTPGAVNAVVLEYRHRFAEILDRAALPHDLPPAMEALQTGLGEVTGPKKPALVHAFKPLGYDCHGESGTFTLRRRTASNLTVEISLDVGTWSKGLTGSYLVQGLDFTARLPLPVSKHAGAGQYKIGGPERWQRIVENLAALVVELDRSFVPAIEAASGPSPDWYLPES